MKEIHTFNSTLIISCKLITGTFTRGTWTFGICSHP